MGSPRISFDTDAAPPLPGWLPDPVRLYLAHTLAGIPIRALARAEARQPSTVLRQVRRIEARRDDPLTDAGLTRLARAWTPTNQTQELLPMMTARNDEEIAGARETLRVLSALMEPRSLLVVADGVEDAVVVRDNGDGRPVRRAVLGRDLAEVLALREWIAGKQTGRLARYTITAAGRAEAGRLMAEAESRRASMRGSAEDPEVVDAQALFAPPEARGTGPKRSAGTDAPFEVLARRPRADGAPWLPAELVAAAHRFRETWEIARIGGALTTDWERLVTGRVSGGGDLPGTPAPARRLAAERSLEGAIRALGPDLAETVLLGVCQEQGMEDIEKRLDFPARSGKIVLRIALRSLARHYREVGSEEFDLIS